MTRQDKEDFNEIGNDESDNVLIEEAGVDRGVNDPRIMFLMNLFLGLFISFEYFVVLS